MDLAAGFQLHEWTVHPGQNRLTGPDGGDVHLNCRAMDVLLYMARRPGEVISREEFRCAIWGRAVVTDGSLTWCISELRRQLGDRASTPRFIETIPKRGYRLIARVSSLSDDDPARNQPLPGEESVPAGEGRDVDAPRPRTWRRWWRPGVLVLSLVVLAAVGWGVSLVNPEPEKSTDMTIAVLPLENFAGDDQELLVEGFHHDLLTRLSRVADLSVTSRTSVRQYRDTVKSVPEIAEELGVRWIVEGALQRADEQIHLNAQLIDAETDTHAWARTYQREMNAENLFAIQSELTRDIAHSLRAALSSDEQARLDRLPTENLHAWALFNQARDLLRQRTESSMRAAAELLRQSIEDEPGLALAWAGLADVQVLLAYYGHESLEAGYPDPREAAERALELDPDLAYGHAVQGLVYMQIDRNGPAALRSFGHAHALSSEYIGWLAWMTAVLGNLEAAIALAEKQVRQAPFSAAVHGSLASLYLADSQPDRARTHARKARELSPLMRPSHPTEALALSLLGQQEDAVTMIDKRLQQVAGQSRDELLAWLAVVHRQNGDMAQAMTLKEELKGSDNAFALGLAHAAVGEHDAAFEQFARAGWNDFQTLHIRFHPMLDDLRADSRFPALIEMVDRSWGMEEARPALATPFDDLLKSP
ncbi:MAG: winged helix-turn-helix domain-containing protein [Wenzhouxiangella sp.]